jgi:phytoene synthase
MPGKPEAHGPRFFAWLYSTPTAQPVLTALCAIEREIGASLRPGIDHHVAHARLEWWRGECIRSCAGSPAHPLTRELRALLEQLAPGARAHSALAELSGLVDAATWDLAHATFERRAELTAYCRRWAAAMITPVGAAALAPADLWQEGAAGSWTDYGAALREIELLGDLAREARAGRLRVPLEELERAGVAPEALASPPWPEGLADVLRGRHQALRRQLTAAVASLAPTSQQSCRGLLVWGALALQASLRAERALPQAPAAASVASAAAANWCAWRAARAAGAGRLRLG